MDEQSGLRSLTPATQRRTNLAGDAGSSTRKASSFSSLFVEHAGSSGTPTSANQRSSSFPYLVPFSSTRPVPGQERDIMNMVPESQWVPDDMANECCMCREEFNLIKRRHHCRTCGRLVCDDCSNHRVKGERTCSSCWDRLGRKMSGIGLNTTAVTTPRNKDGRGIRRSALAELLEEERFNREFVLADGRKVGYSVAGASDGLPVFLFLGLDAHRHSAAHFEDPARRRGLRLICIDRPGRGRSDPVPVPEKKQSAGVEGSNGGGMDGGGSMVEVVEAAVVDTVKQMCAKLRLDKAAVMGQSLGAVFALRCARDPDLKVTMDDTAVCLVSPWVPLVAEGSNPMLKTMSKSDIMKGALDVNSLTAAVAIKTVSEMALWKSSSGASEIEKGYLEAPYTQELIKHVSELKEGKSSIGNEVAIALRSAVLEEELVRGGEVLHPVHIWHGRNDKLVPYEAIKWLQGVLPDCEVTVKLGGTHALMYDKGEMEGVFTALQKSMTEAKSKARFSARRITNSLSYVASDVMALASASPAAGPEATAVPAAGAISPRLGKKPSKDAPESTPVASGGSEGDSEHSRVVDPNNLNLRDKFVKAIATVIDNNNAVTGTGSNHGSWAAGGESSHGSTNSSGHGSSSGVHLSAANGSGHGSGHGGNGLSSVATNVGLPGRWMSTSGGSRHSAVGVGSLHGSIIPEDGEIAWGSGHATMGVPGGDGVEGSNNLLNDLGRQLHRALSVASVSSAASGAPGGSEHGSTSSGSGGGAAQAGGPRTPLASTHVDHDYGDSGAEGFLEQVGRMVTMSLTGGSSGHGSASGERESVGDSSAHGSPAGGGDWGGMGGGSKSNSHKPSGLVLPWSQHSNEGTNQYGGRLDVAGGGGGALGGGGTPLADSANVLDEMKRGMERALSNIGVGSGAPSPATLNETRSVFSYSTSIHDPMAALGSSSRHSVNERRAATAAAAGVSLAAGYEAARANWPAGKVEGEPAWEEWGYAKKLIAHFITASCLALIVATF